nr:hypothetical protein Itr_chr13CG16970 [Ipomoea trifida]
MDGESNKRVLLGFIGCLIVEVYASKQSSAAPVETFILPVGGGFGVRCAVAERWRHAVANGGGPRPRVAARCRGGRRVEAEAVRSLSRLAEGRGRGRSRVAEAVAECEVRRAVAVADGGGCRGVRMAVPDLFFAEGVAGGVKDFCIPDLICSSRDLGGF